jgi:hypothetical protein
MERYHAGDECAGVEDDLHVAFARRQRDDVTLEPLRTGLEAGQLPAPLVANGHLGWARCAGPAQIEPDHSLMRQQVDLLASLGKESHP